MSAEERRVAENRRARFDYEIIERVEAGMVLYGTEVKSLRQGHANLRDSHALVRQGECWLINLHIPRYEQGNRWNHEPDRARKLLLHRREIKELEAKVKQRGFTLVPLRVYFDARGRAKVELALARGKKLYDKRESIARRDADRRIARAVRGRR
ncbi:MAG: SsrA-binding protein SmpB [Thermaerobacter sp.]|nr:SsrA-binding protein SmpB [Thermaerobacter sp.]